MRLSKFKVCKYRNIQDSGWIDVNDITAFVGQNEAGKSNLFEALHCLNPYVEGAAYDTSEDWPIDDWGGRQDSEGTLVCEAYFDLNESDIADLFGQGVLGQEARDEDEYDEYDDDAEDDEDAEEAEVQPPIDLPETVRVYAWRCYGDQTGFEIENSEALGLDAERASEWAEENTPKFVLIHDYEMSGTQVELTDLRTRWDQHGRENRHLLSNDDQTILVVLDLAQIDIDEFIDKGATAEGRTVRSFDKRAASAYLTQQFQKLWTQKAVRFEIEIDGPTLNIFAVDEAIGFPVRLNRRSTGFRWYVSFAWKFTHASGGEYQNCILLLEEPGIHLHYSGQRDLLRAFEDLSATNTILYTTHLASMVDQANPERVRIVESRDNNHLAITHGVVSSQTAPMAVIETALGLTPDLSGMLGNRKVLIVEGGTDALIISKLSGVLIASGKEGLSDQIYLWPAQTASKTPMYAAFAIGQKWDAGVLLDSDSAGQDAKKKIAAMDLKEVADADGSVFRTLMLGDASGIKKTDVAIEDLFPDDFYRGCVNTAYGLAIQDTDLPVDGSTMIATRVEKVLKNKHSMSLDKKRVLAEMLKQFDTWSEVQHLPEGTAAAAESLFRKINGAFET